MDFDYRRILDAISDAVIAANREGRIVYANREAESVLGWGEGELVGQPLTALIPARLHAAHHSGFQRYVATGEARLIGRAVRVPAVRRNGAELEFELTLSAFQEREGELVVAVLRELSERIELERSLNVTRYLQAATAAAARLATHREMPHLLPAVVQTLIDDFDAAVAGIWLCEGETGALHLRACAAHSPQALPDLPALVDGGRRSHPVAAAARAPASWVLQGLAAEPHFAPGWAERHRLHSLAGFPLRSGGELRGVFVAFFRQEVPPEVVEVLCTFAALVATSLTDAQQLERQQEAERALAESEARFRTVFESAGIGIGLVGLDGRLLDSNPALQRMLGYAAEELQGRSAGELTYPEDVRADWELFVELLEGRRTQYQLDKRYLHKSGAIVWGQLTLSLVRGEEGQPLFAAALVQDVTAQRRASAALREGEERLRAIADNSPSVIFLKDLEGRYLLMNRHEHTLLWDQPRDVVVGKTDYELFPREVADHLRDNDRQVLEAGRTLVFEEVDEGELPRHFISYKFPLFRDDGAAYALGGISTEITELKRLQTELRERVEELAEADRRKDEFLATLAHELRNPLAGITNSLYLLRGYGAPEARASELREIIARQSEYLARLVDDLLDVSRITRGLIELRPEPLDFAQVVAQVVEANQGAIQSRGHTLSVLLPPAPLSVEADPLRLEQVLSNLLSNAAKYTPPGGQIRLAIERAGDRAVLRVQDTGMGIPAELLPRIFDLFTQADRSHARTHGGLGIGLYLVRRLVELHGGAIEAHSAGPEQGSEFVVSLPLRNAEVKTISAESEPRNVAGSNLQGSQLHRSGAAGPDVHGSSFIAPRLPRVLIIEDNPDAAETLQEILELAGHAVAVAGSGPEGLGKAQAWQPEVVLCDIGLPGMDGYQVAAELRGRPETAGVRLIALTGFGQAEDERRARGAGFDRHLTKPVQPDQLLALLSEAPYPLT